MRASSLSFKLAVGFVLVGMAWGIVMAASGDHGTMPAHAHLNLLGWVSLFLFGIFYKLHPALERSRLALAQIGLWSVGTAVLAVAVGLIHSGHAEAEPAAGIASFALVGAMLMFGYLVWRGESRVNVGAAMVAAE